MSKPDYIGTVIDVTMTKIDGHKFLYFCFGLRLQGQQPGVPPLQVVLYVNPNKDHAVKCAGQVIVSMSKKEVVDVYIDREDKAVGRIREVRPSKRSKRRVSSRKFAV